MPLIQRIDLAHPPLRAAQAEEALTQALAAARNSPQLRVIKVIHGYGSSGRGGTTREVVRNWAFRMRGRLRGVIAGEDYSLFNAGTQAMHAETGPLGDPDLDAGNRGVTYLWVR